MYVVNTTGKKPEDIVAYAKFLKELPDSIPDSIRAEIIVTAEEMSTEELGDLTLVLGQIGSLPEILKR